MLEQPVPALMWLRWLQSMPEQPFRAPWGSSSGHFERPGGTHAGPRDHFERLGGTQTDPSGYFERSGGTRAALSGSGGVNTGVFVGAKSPKALKFPKTLKTRAEMCIYIYICILVARALAQGQFSKQCRPKRCGTCFNARITKPTTIKKSLFNVHEMY